MIGKFLFKVIIMGDLPNLPVTVATDWWAIILVGFLSGLGTVAGVYLGIKLSLKSFYSQKWWEKKANIYLKTVDKMHDLISDSRILELSELAYSNPRSADMREEYKLSYDGEQLHLKNFKNTMGQLSSYYRRYKSILSKETIKNMENWVSEMNKINDEEKYLDTYKVYFRYREATETALIKIETSMKKDLSI